MNKPARVNTYDVPLGFESQHFADQDDQDDQDDQGQIPAIPSAGHENSGFYRHQANSTFPVAAGFLVNPADPADPKDRRIVGATANLLSPANPGHAANPEDPGETSACRESDRQMRQYLLLALVGAFFSLTEETQLLGEMLAIPFLLSIIRVVHMGFLFRECLACVRQFGKQDSYFKSGLEGAFGYPFVVLLLTTLVTSALLIFVVPQFKDIFLGMRVELPLMTQFVIFTSDVMVARWWLILPIVSGIPMFVAKSFARRSVRERLTPWLQRLPVMGRIYEDSVLMAFLRQWGALLEDGLTSAEAFRRAGLKAASRADLRIIHTFMQADPVLRAEWEASPGAALRPLLRTYEQLRAKSVASRVQIVEVVAIVFMGLVITSIVLTFFMPMGCLCNCAPD